MPPADPALAADRAKALALTPVSRETLERLDRFVALLLDWQGRMNLIAPSTIPTIWTRHIADSLQLLDLARNARIWIDLGSGAGFPGMVIACALADTPGATVHLVESTKKKAAFLSEAQQVTGAPAKIYPERIETFVPTFDRQGRYRHRPRARAAAGAVRANRCAIGENRRPRAVPERAGRRS